MHAHRRAVAFQEELFQLINNIQRGGSTSSEIPHRNRVTVIHQIHGRKFNEEM
jgi:hypothetical protein